ncbi:MAG: hypothetical protein JST55_12345 [Bacteroidetes bacterium]|nr:hypothetical protein [Bacteroidota bacterium]
MNFVKKYFLTITGIAAGAIGGYLYYFYIGCASGTCAITSNPVNSTIYGAVMGGLLFSMFKTSKERTSQNENGNIL